VGWTCSFVGGDKKYIQSTGVEISRKVTLQKTEEKVEG
jgi:hypothetical protein